MQSWTSHTPFTDPGAYATAMDRIGADPRVIVEAVQGLLIHGGGVEHYGLPARPFSRQTLPVEARLEELLSADASPLSQARAPANRAVGTCRDYAVLVCAALRHQGHAARVRCGFASYLGGAPWEDHWICELQAEPRWTRIDAQLDPIMQQALGTNQDAASLPPSAFLDASEAWRACRAGERDSADFGHGDARGLWFMLVNLARDRLALQDQLTSPWDGWRAVAPSGSAITEAMLAMADELAEDGSTAAPPEPWWIAS